MLHHRYQYSSDLTAIQPVLYTHLLFFHKLYLKCNVWLTLQSNQHITSLTPDQIILCRLTRYVYALLQDLRHERISLPKVVKLLTDPHSVCEIFGVILFYHEMMLILNTFINLRLICLPFAYVCYVQCCNFVYYCYFLLLMFF